MKMLLVGFASVAAVLTGCSGNSFDMNETAVSDGPEAYIVEKQPDGTIRETMWCGPYMGPGSATIRVVRPHDEQQVCSYYKNLMVKFLTSEAAYSPSGSGVIYGWECQNYGWVKTGKLGYAVECTRGKETVYLDVKELDSGESDTP